MTTLGAATIDRIGVLCALSLTAFVAGCGGTPDQEELGSLESEESELGEASCANFSGFNGTVLANAVSVLSEPPQPILGDMSRSPTTYNLASCFKAWKVRVNGPTGGNSWVPGTNVTKAYVGMVSPPTNEADCNDSSIRAILYAQERALDGSTYVFEAEDLRSNPFWDPLFGDCVISWIDLGKLNRSSPSLPYHIAATARVGSNTRAVDVVVTKDPIPPPTRPLCELLDTCVSPP